MSRLALMGSQFPPFQPGISRPAETNSPDFQRESGAPAASARAM